MMACLCVLSTSESIEPFEFDLLVHDFVSLALAKFRHIHWHHLRTDIFVRCLRILLFKSLQTNIAGHTGVELSLWIDSKACIQKIPMHVPAHGYTSSTCP